MPFPKDRSKNKLKQLYRERPDFTIIATLIVLVLIIVAVITSCFAWRMYCVYIAGQQRIEAQRPEKSLRIFTTDVEVSSVELACANQQAFTHLAQNPGSWNAWKSYYACGPQTIRATLKDGEQVLIGFYGNAENTRFRDIALLPSSEESIFRLLDYRRLLQTIKCEEAGEFIWYKLLYEGAVRSAPVGEEAEVHWIRSVR